MKKLLDKWLEKWSMSKFFAGIIIAYLGVTGVVGGGILFQSSATAPPSELLTLSALPTWICWLFFIMGMDEAVFGGWVLVLIFNKILQPAVKFILFSLVGQEKVEKFFQKLEKLSKKPENQEEK